MSDLDRLQEIAKRMEWWGRYVGDYSPDSPRGEIVADCAEAATAIKALLDAVRALEEIATEYPHNHGGDRDVAACPVCFAEVALARLTTRESP